MIMRIYLMLGLLLLGVTAYFVVIQQPPTFQGVPDNSEVTRLQEEGILPEGPLVENEEVEHDVFGVPPKDEEMLEQAMANMDMDMGNMDMGSGEMDMGNMNMGEGSSMDMAEGGAASGEMDMDMDGDGVMDMSSADMNSGTAMDMGEGSSMDMAEGMAMDMSEGEGDGMDMSEAPEMDEEEADRMEAAMAAGLMVTDDGEFDREISLTMTEWGFSDMQIDTKAGERIKFTLRNEGKVLHEFMFMSMAGMQAVNYRARRADWNLLEHEALFEKSLLLPGEEVTFVAQVIKPGVWMYMCMLPYHMQMGMMGQMATEGMAMEM